MVLNLWHKAAQWVLRLHNPQFWRLEKQGGGCLPKQIVHKRRKSTRSTREGWEGYDLQWNELWVDDIQNEHVTVVSTLWRFCGRGPTVDGSSSHLLRSGWPGGWSSRGTSSMTKLSNWWTSVFTLSSVSVWPFSSSFSFFLRSPTSSSNVAIWSFCCVCRRYLN